MFDRNVAESLFASLEKHWITEPSEYGMRRPSYSAEEEEAAAFFLEQAKALQIPAYKDGAGNYYFILEGTDPLLPAIVSGSHVDSVPRGGRYDGPAGVVAPFSVLAAFKKQGIKPPHTVCAMIIRGEEGAWFGQVSIGAKLATGELDTEKLQQLHRADTQLSLYDSMQQIGLKPQTLENKSAVFPLRQTACFIELHIEQGPLLKDKNLPVGIVTGIRGNIRYREIKCVGEAGHTGTVPHHMRKDAVRASVYVLHTLEVIFTAMQQQNMDLVFTFPVANTGAAGAHTTIPYDFRFAIEVRSQSKEVIDKAQAAIEKTIKEAETKFHVRFELPTPIKTLPATMDDKVQTALAQETEKMKLPVFSMPSGAGHDTSVFANAGIPSGMIFIRHNGISHNPEEDMPMDDFTLGTNLLAHFMQKGLVVQGQTTQSFIQALVQKGAVRL
jgi:N-carbamoyl-L-amino-acid hydrolase